MVSFGSKALQRKKFKLEETPVSGDDMSPRQSNRKKAHAGRKFNSRDTLMSEGKKLSNHRDGSKTLQQKNSKSREAHITVEETVSKNKKCEKNKIRRHTKELRRKDEAALPSKHQSASITPFSVPRKRVDPETAKYFAEIANLIEGGGIDVDELSAVCGNAMDETRGKEIELATDPIISRTLQKLIDGCDVGQLCYFLGRCGKELSLLATDKSGSHVLETALRSLSLHLRDADSNILIEETIRKMLQAIVINAVDVLCSCYGSHVLRSLLCLCKGVLLDSSENFHAKKSSSLLAERLSCSFPHSGGDNFSQLHQGFPDLLKFLVRSLLKNVNQDIGVVQTNRYSSFVMQTALKLLAGDDELLRVIPILLGTTADALEQKCVEPAADREIMELLKDTSYSHLVEVILEVAPETLYDKIFRSVFMGSLFSISSHNCGSFVVQALVSSAKNEGQIGMIWKELGHKLIELFANGKSGVVASLLAACKRFKTHEHECCQALFAAISSSSESSECLVPRILFLEEFFRCDDKSSWNWSKGDTMHLMGCLILQTIFKYPIKFIGPYVKSIASMDANHLVETAKDSGGCRVIESFLCSDASAKQKNKVIAKLRGNFKMLAMHPSSSFTVERSFTAANISLKEAIVSELVTVQADLSKTKHGPYLLKKLDADGFAKRPDQWKSRQTSRKNVHEDFAAAFGVERASKKRDFLAAPSPLMPAHNLKKLRKEIDQAIFA